tara:strand:+ start:722 stop:1102 length:381 start_codon:yes stop_codon:yes gene_type:complete
MCTPTLPLWAETWFNNVHGIENNHHQPNEEDEYKPKEKLKKRKPPKTLKICNICECVAENVFAASKKCPNSSCKGTLVINMNKEKKLKRNPPLTKKECSKCCKVWENVPTATKKCLRCSSYLITLK